MEVVRLNLPQTSSLVNEIHRLLVHDEYAETEFRVLFWNTLGELHPSYLQLEGTEFDAYATEEGYQALKQKLFVTPATQRKIVALEKYDQLRRDNIRNSQKQ